MKNFTYKGQEYKWVDCPDCGGEAYYWTRHGTIVECLRCFGNGIIAKPVRK